jgi:tetraacyldisaccharide 4'-kinase
LDQWFNRTSSGLTTEVTNLTDKKLLTVSGIGNPKAFERTLVDMGGVLTSTIRYPDHHKYTLEDMHQIMQQALEHKVDYIITTEKDAVKIPPGFVRDVDWPVPMLILGIEIKMTVGNEELIQFIHNELKKTNEPSTKLQNHKTLTVI